MNLTKHIIRRQSVDFTYNGKTDGFAMQNAVSDWCTNSLIPGLELELEKINFKDKYISIEKLEIDTTVSTANWQLILMNQVLEHLKYQLIEYLPGGEEIENTTVKTGGRFTELILFYFEKGYLPWWSSAVITNDFETALSTWINQTVNSSADLTFRLKLKQIFSPQVQERILQVIPVKELFSFCKIIIPEENTMIEQAEIFVTNFLTEIVTPAKRRSILSEAHRFILAALVNEQKIPTGLAQILFDRLNKKTTTELVKHISEITARYRENTIADALLELIKKETAANKTISENKSTSTRSKKITKLNFETEEAASKDLLKSEPHKKQNTEIDLKEGIFIENAGAVIFAAYLPMLFQRLNFTDNNIISKPDLAIAAIHYAATAKNTCDEYELVLPKILCGIELEMPIKTNIKLIAAQKKEINEMLSSVINYWSAIGDTSIDGLRASFLQRSGKMSLTGNKWTLQVEQKAYDMLLQQLPWNISMIKLPWMKELLKTEWV